MRHSLAILIAVVVIAVLALPAAVAQKADQADVQLKAAIKKEVVDGDLKGAITEFQRIVNTPGVSRTVAAMALVHLGQCHEKLGNAEARRSYERVLKEYPDQADAVRQARDRLAVVAKAGPSPDERLGGRLLIGSSQHLRVAVSPDGRHVAYCCSVSAAMVVHDVASGREQTLSVEPAAAPRFSPDSEQIAYVTQRSAGPPELRALRRSGSDDHLLFAAPDVTAISLYGWMPDGAAVLVKLVRADKTTEMALVPVTGSAPRRIVSPAPAAGGSGAGSLSPEGRYFSYRAQATAGGPWTTRLFMLDRGVDQPLVDRPTNAWNVGWTADGRFAFYSAEAHSEGIWIVSVADGRAQGPAERVFGKLDAAIVGVGVSDRGQFFYQKDVSDPQVHVMAVPPGSGPLEPIQALSGATAPSWSPDGKYLAYGQSLTGLIAIRTLAGGATRTLWTGLPGAIMSLGWFPDRSGLTAQGLGPDGTRSSVGLYRVDLVSGSLSDILVGGNWLEFGANPTVSPDGRAVLYKAAEGSDTTSLIRYDLQTREREVLLQRKVPEYVGGFAVAPGTGQIAVAMAESLPPAGTDGQRQTASSIGLLDTATRQLRTIYRLPLGTFVPAAVTLAWMPDGKSLLFVSRPSGAAGPRWSLFRIQVTGGQPEKVFEAVSIWQVRVHPNGNQVALDIRSGRMETFVVDNLFGGAKK